MTTLSVIIVTYNPGDLVIECLNSVEAASMGLEVEVIVVDNASADGTPDRLRDHFERVEVIANPDNPGFATATNQGLAIAHGEYLLLLNPDVLVRPDSLTGMIDFMQAHPRVGIIGPRTFDGQGRVALTAFPTYGPKMLLWQYLGLDRVLPYRVYGHYRRQVEQASEAFDVETIQASCFMLRREVYHQIGGLDESFFLFCEEPDFCERARAIGWKVSYVPDIHIIHYGSTTVSRYTATRLRSYHMSPLVYFRKRGRTGAMLILKLGFTLELLIKLMLRLVQLALGKRELALHARTYVTLIGEIWTPERLRASRQTG